MNDSLTILSVAHTGHCWRVTYDGVVLGDSRGFGTEAEARRQVDAEIAIDERDARKYGRPRLYVKGAA